MSGLSHTTRMYLCPLPEMTDTSSRSIATRSNFPDTGTCPIGWWRFTGDFCVTHTCGMQ